MADGGSIMTMTYYGAEKVVPKYNVMGVAKSCVGGGASRYLAYDRGKNKIRVNAISAGPIKTLAARGIAGFGDMPGRPGRTCSSATQRGCERSGVDRGLPGQLMPHRYYRRNHLPSIADITLWGSEGQLSVTSCQFRASSFRQLNKSPFQLHIDICTYTI